MTKEKKKEVLRNICFWLTTYGTFFKLKLSASYHAVDFKTSHSVFVKFSYVYPYCAVPLQISYSYIGIPDA